MVLNSKTIFHLLLIENTCWCDYVSKLWFGLSIYRYKSIHFTGLNKIRMFSQSEIKVLTYISIRASLQDLYIRISLHYVVISALKSLYDMVAILISGGYFSSNTYRHVTRCYRKLEHVKVHLLPWNLCIKIHRCCSGIIFNHLQ